MPIVIHELIIRAQVGQINSASTTASNDEERPPQTSPSVATISTAVEQVMDILKRQKER